MDDRKIATWERINNRGGSGSWDQACIGAIRRIVEFCAIFFPLARDYTIGGAYWAAVIATIFSAASAEGMICQ
jgi:hypothetical protein